MPSPAFRRATNLWNHLRSMLARLFRWSQNDGGERQAARTRARFWAEVREGQREAEADSQLRP